MVNDVNWQAIRGNLTVDEQKHSQKLGRSSQIPFLWCQYSIDHPFFSAVSEALPQGWNPCHQASPQNILPSPVQREIHIWEVTGYFHPTLKT